MMRAQWEGRTWRHGAQTATVPETLNAALVQWFVYGAVVEDGQPTPAAPPTDGGELARRTAAVR